MGISYKVGQYGNLQKMSLVAIVSCACCVLPAWAQASRELNHVSNHTDVWLPSLNWPVDAPAYCRLEKPPSAYDRSLLRSSSCCRSFALYCFHFLQQKRKCGIDSMSPHLHSAVSDALILSSYILRPVLPAWSRAKIAVSELFNLLV